MKPFETVTGRPVPFLNTNVDTDVIIRIEHLAKDEDLGKYAFEALRYQPDGTLNPDCIFNQPRYLHAAILLAGPNFGCGSSREGAVTALWGMGVRVVMAPSFGDIFFANCARNGLLPIVLDLAIVEDLAQTAEGKTLTVSLESQMIHAADGRRIPFSIDPHQREMLLLGADEIDMTMAEIGRIEEWQRHNRKTAPWIWQVEQAHAG